MIAASNNTNRIMQDLKNTLDDWELEIMFSKKSTEYLLETLDAIRENRYPTPGHKSPITSVLHDRISAGTVIAWREQRWSQ